MNDLPAAGRHRRTYLGDALYVELTNGMLRLFTSDGVEDLDEIYLEPGTLEQLIAYAGRVWPQNGNGDEPFDAARGEDSA